jgi:rhodanese-related sulfurtransferase
MRNQTYFHFRLWPVALLVLLATASPLFCESISWKIVNATIRADFPAVPRIGTAELAEWLADEKRELPVLLDVRTEPEFEISHLQNAQRVAPGSPAAAIKLAKDHPILTYCSVGYRSGAFAETLRQAGYARVVNLEGSIFQWANEGRPLFRGTERVAQVHPYNRIWGLLLAKRYRAHVPSNPK